MGFEVAGVEGEGVSTFQTVAKAYKNASLYLFKSTVTTATLDKE